MPVQLGVSVSNLLRCGPRGGRGTAACRGVRRRPGRSCWHCRGALAKPSPWRVKRSILGVWVRCGCGERAVTLKRPEGNSRSTDRGVRVEPAPSFTDPAGLYIVASRSSLHLFDLAAGAYLRLPGERANTFPGDLAVLRLTQVERIAVGDSFFIWLDDPREYAVMD